MDRAEEVSGEVATKVQASADRGGPYKFVAFNRVSNSCSRQRAILAQDTDRPDAGLSGRPDSSTRLPC